MRILKKTSFLILAVGLAFLPLVGEAAYLGADSQYTLPGGELIEDNVYVAGGNVAASSEVAGDLFAAGGNILVAGNVRDDLAVLGGTITMTGGVGDDARLVGGNITVTGSTGGELVVVGGQVLVARGAVVAGNAILTGGVLTFQGEAGGAGRFYGQEIIIDGIVNGDVVIRAEEKLVIGDNARISGNLVYSSPEGRTEIAEGAVIEGEREFKVLEKMNVSSVWKPTVFGVFTFLSIWWLIRLLGVLFAALILYFVFKRRVREMAEKAVNNFGWELLRGFLVVVVVPIMAILLLFSIIGFGLAITIGVIYIVLILVAIALSGVILGEILKSFIFKRKTLVWYDVVLGVVLIKLIGLVPFIGWLVALAFLLVAVGAILKLGWEITR